MDFTGSRCASPKVTRRTATMCGLSVFVSDAPHEAVRITIVVHLIKFKAIRIAERRQEADEKRKLFRKFPFVLALALIS